MYVPLHILVAIAAAVTILLVMLLRRDRGRDDLMGTPRKSTPRQPPPRIEIPPALAADVQALIARGQTIEAIKHVRRVTGLGLKESKDVVDGMKR